MIRLAVSPVATCWSASKPGAGAPAGSVAASLVAGFSAAWLPAGLGRGPEVAESVAEFSAAVAGERTVAPGVAGKLDGELAGVSGTLQPNSSAVSAAKNR